MKKILLSSLLAFAASAGASFGAAIVTINFDSGSQILKDSIGVTLTGGTSADGNGAVIQLGYYDGATSANNFLGNWVALSGEGSLNTGVIPGSNPSETFDRTSIGDSNAGGASHGQFAISLTFSVGDALTGNSLPGGLGIPLAIRIYNNTTKASSTGFNVVSDDLWMWKTPASAPNNPVINMSLDDAGLEWQGGSASAFKTTLAVPEPSTVGALLGGTAILMWRRRRS